MISYFGLVFSRVHKFWTLTMQCRRERQRLGGKCRFSNLKILKFYNVFVLLPAPLRPTLLNSPISLCRIFYVRKAPFIKISFSSLGRMGNTMTYHFVNWHLLTLKYYLQRSRSVDGTTNIVSLFGLRFTVAVQLICP